MGIALIQVVCVSSPNVITYLTFHNGITQYRKGIITNYKIDPIHPNYPICNLYYNECLHRLKKIEGTIMHITLLKDYNIKLPESIVSNIGLKGKTLASLFTQSE